MTRSQLELWEAIDRYAFEHGALDVISWLISYLAKLIHYDDIWCAIKDDDTPAHCNVRGVLTYQEILRQEYPNDGKFIAAGLVSGHEHDVLYIEFGNDTKILLRLDEAASLIWALAGAIYSQEMEHV